MRDGDFSCGQHIMQTSGQYRVAERYDQLCAHFERLLPVEVQDLFAAQMHASMHKDHLSNLVDAGHLYLWRHGPLWPPSSTYRNAVAVWSIVGARERRLMFYEILISIVHDIFEELHIEEYGYLNRHETGLRESCRHSRAACMLPAFQVHKRDVDRVLALCWWMYENLTPEPPTSNFLYFRLLGDIPDMNDRENGELGGLHTHISRLLDIAEQGKEVPLDTPSSYVRVRQAMDFFIERINTSVQLITFPGYTRHAASYPLVQAWSKELRRYDQLPPPPDLHMGF